MNIIETFSMYYMDLRLDRTLYAASPLTSFKRDTILWCREGVAVFSKPEKRDEVKQGILPDDLSYPNHIIYILSLIITQKIKELNKTISTAFCRIECRIEWYLICTVHNSIPVLSSSFYEDLYFWMMPKASQKKRDRTIEGNDDY